jgi:hypothetical protein
MTKYERLQTDSARQDCVLSFLLEYIEVKFANHVDSSRIIRSEILTTVGSKITAFLDEVLCQFADSYQSLR